MSPFRQTPRSCCFSETLAQLGPVERHYAGVKTIHVEEIVGSVGRCRELDENFHYVKRRHDERYESVRKAMEKGIGLPPIEVYALVGLYYVVDGHHRVAVAKEVGQVFIDAEVVEYVALDDVGPACVPHQPHDEPNPLGVLAAGARDLAQRLVEPVRQQIETGTFCPYHTMGPGGEVWCAYSPEEEGESPTDERV